MLEIIVAGAGIGGLTFANAIQQKNKNIRIRLFERDSAQRPQGSSLNLKETGGLLALEKLGFLEELQLLSEPRTQLTFVTSQGTKLMRIPHFFQGAQPPLRIRRQILRDVLLLPLDPQLISYNSTVVDYVQHQGKIKILLENGKEEVADLLIASDGVHSKIRQKMIGDSLQYLGVSAIGSTCVIPPKGHFLWNHPLMKEAGDHVFYVGSGMAMFCFREQHSFVWQFTQHVTEQAWMGFSGEQLKQKVQESISGWTQEVIELVNLSSADSLVKRGYYDREPIKKAYEGRCVLLGDAAHPMSPIEGQGGNMAMADAIELAELLTSMPEHLDEALVLYQDQMLQRSNKWQKKSRNQVFRLHHPGKINQVFRNVGLWTVGRFFWLRELFSR